MIIKTNSVALILSLVFCFVFQKTGFGQRSMSDNRPRKLMYSVGVSVGGETFIGAPKFGLYKSISINDKERSFRYAKKQSPMVYAGVEGSLFVFFGGVFSAGPSLGFAFGNLTLDNNIVYTLVTSPDNLHESYLSYNPKVGMTLGPVWLKCGPNFMLLGSYPWEKWMQVGKARMNIEFLYLVR